MKYLIVIGLLLGLWVSVNTVLAAPALVGEAIDVPAGGEELFIQRYAAQGDHLIIWIAPGYGSHERAFETSARLVEKGVEVWHVDLADSLFRPKNTTTMRNLEGVYVKDLIDAAHKQTGKKITLLTRSYGALPLLSGVRDWQQAHQHDQVDYLNGAILLSPEMYSTIPALGEDPVYAPITSATNIPIVIYQAGKRSNRWQLGSLLENLQQGGAQVFTKIKSGVVGILYIHDNSPTTLAMLKALPDEIIGDLKLLSKLPKPKQVAPLVASKPTQGPGLDNALKSYVGKTEPLPLDLISATGVHYQRDKYQGKVTVVNFWATWCPPCVEEIPSLNNLRKAMKDDSFELISVNYAESKQDVDDFLKKVNVDFPVLLDEDGKVSASWNVLVFPSTFVIGPDGEIHYGVNGAIHWDSEDVVNAFKAMLFKEVVAQ